MVFDGGKDLNFDKSLKVIRKEVAVLGGEFIFDPDSLKDEAKAYRVESSRLSEEELCTYAELATRLRVDFAAKAKEMMVAADDAANGNDDVELPASILKLGRGCKKELEARDTSTAVLAFETGCHGKRRRKESKHSLSAAQLQRIVKLVLQEGLS